MKVLLNSTTNIEYAAYYIKGLYDMYGNSSVFFTSKNFQDYENIFNFIVQNNEKTVKYVIDYSDSQDINLAAYDWCDFYGKINYKLGSYNGFVSKIVVLPPNFGINIWGFIETVETSISNYIKSRGRVKNTKKFFSKYYKQVSKIPISGYKPFTSKDNYIFSVSTLWNSDEWIRNDETVNLNRAVFFEACQAIPSLNFEGGFVYSQIKNENPRFQHLILKKSHIEAQEYLHKLKSSTLAFNTPAWAMCHGWKLGEYLALGKAIISTPLVNELPEQLKHGKNVHYVSGEFDEVKEAIELILNDKSYRHKLECGAREYYLKYVEPSETIKLLCERKDIDNITY